MVPVWDRHILYRMKLLDPGRARIRQVLISFLRRFPDFAGFALSGTLHVDRSYSELTKELERA